MKTYNELEEERIKLCSEKTGLNLKLSDIGLRIRGRRLEQSLYTQLCREQKFLNRAVRDIEVRLAEIKIEMNRIRSEEHAAAALRPKKGNGDDPTTVTRLHTMRDKYHVLRNDQKAAPEIRVIAYDVFMEVDAIIQAALRRI